MTATDEPDYLTGKEIAARYRVNDETVRHWRKVGKGPAWVRAGRSVIYPLAEVRAFDERLLAEAAAARTA